MLDQLGRPAEIVVVDDGSTDGSFERLVGSARDGAPPARRAPAAQLRADGGAGRGHRGWRAATRSSPSTPICRTIRATSRALLAALRDDVDVVNGWRRERQDPWLTRRLPSQIANRIISAVTGTRLHDYGCTLRVMRASVAKELRLYGELHRFIPALAADLGARVVELPVAHRPRTLGRSKYGLSRTLRVMLDLLTVKFLSGFATRPIQLFGLVGLAARGPRHPAARRSSGSSASCSASALAGRPIVLLAILLDRARRPVHLDRPARRDDGAHVPRVAGQADLPRSARSSRDGAPELTSHETRR